MSGDISGKIFALLAKGLQGDGVEPMSTKKKSEVSSIYRIVNQKNGHFYIGVTTRPVEQRRDEHFWAAARNKEMYAIHRAIRKHGRAAFITEVIEVHATPEAAYIRERELVAQLSPVYNSAEGGRGGRGALGHTWDEARHEIGKQALRRRFEAERTEYDSSPEGAKRIEAIREKRRDRFDAFRALGPKAMRKPVVCLDDMMEFPSASEAARHYKISGTVISRVCARDPKRATAGKRVFRYAGDIGDRDAELLTAKTRSAARTKASGAARRIPIICLNDQKIFTHAAAAAEFYGLSANHVRRTARGVQSSVGSLKFRNLFPDGGA